MRPFNSLYDPAIDSIALKERERKEIQIELERESLGQFPRPRTIYGGMAISIGSETGVQTTRRT